VSSFASSEVDVASQTTTGPMTRKTVDEAVVGTCTATVNSPVSEGKEHDTPAGETCAGAANSVAAESSPFELRHEQLGLCASVGLTTTTPQTSIQVKSVVSYSKSGLTTTTPEIPALGRRILPHTTSLQRALDEVTDDQLVFAGRYVLINEAAVGAQVCTRSYPQDSSGILYSFQFIAKSRHCN
jgi:hypothetical protein